MNREQESLLAQIHDLLGRFYAVREEPEFVPGRSTVRLMTPTYDQAEVGQVVESLLRGQITLNQTAGNKVARFEQAWADYIGVGEAVMVNSGSSANLLALFTLSNPSVDGHLRPGDEVITPAVTWHTVVSPIWSVGAVPVLADVRQEDLTLDPEAVEALITPRTRAILPVHLLGAPCDMEALGELARRHDLWVIEDCCEAHGAAIGGRRCGSFGHLATFSFFFSHHITTMEGGMMVGDDLGIADLARVLRSQGVLRNTRRREELAAEILGQPEYADLDEGFLFANLGFNLRPTELNGGFGLEQLPRLDGHLARRRENALYWLERLERHRDVFHLPEDPAEEHAWFSFPVIVRDDAGFGRTQLREYLAGCGVETRPIMSGNVAEQPAARWFPHRTGPLPVAERVHRNGLFWGNHPGITPPQREYVADCVDRFLDGLD